MPFNIIQKGQKTDPEKINENFTWIGVGDLLPRAGNSLTATTNVYNLGSSSKRYNNIYIKDIRGNSLTITD